MIYSNRKRVVETKEMPWGTLKAITLGEKGRGRKSYSLPCEVDIEKGSNAYLTIGETKTGNPKAIKKEDDNIFLLVDTYNGYTRRGNGYVQKLKKQTELTSVLVQANGADGDAGRIGQWDDILIKVEKAEEAIYLRIKPSGGSDSIFLEIRRGEVENIGTVEEAMAYFDAVEIIPPFSLSTEGVDLEEWETL